MIKNEKLVRFGIENEIRRKVKYFNLKWSFPVHQPVGFRFKLNFDLRKASSN